MIKFCVKKPFLTVVAVIIVLVIGWVALDSMQTNLLPEMNLPYMLVITTEPGATPENIENDISKPLERALGTVSGVKKLTSTSAENYGIVMLEFESDTNMDSAMVKVSAAVNQAQLPEKCGTPNIMEISMDMMANMYATVSYEGKDIIDLTAFTEDVVVPYIERQDGVASVSEVGAVKETVEVRLNNEKVDDINKQVLEHANDKLADARKDIEKAKKKLKKAKDKLADSESSLSNKQSSTNDSLTTALAGLDDAKATKAAYEATLASLQASQKALEGEQKAYTDNKIKENYDNLDKMFDGFNDSMGKIAAISGISIPKGIEDAVNNPDKLKAFTDWMSGLGYGDKTAALTYDSLKQLYDIVNTRMPQIDTALANLKVEIATAQAVLNAVTDKMKDINDNYQKAMSGALEASSGFGSASAQMSAGKTEIKNAQKELDAALDKLEESEDAALKNANLDALLSLDALSGLIYAQNFAMPAGYIDDKDDNQWMLKVGDEYESEEDINAMVLCKVDGVGIVKLSDVADVTLIDNSGDSYGKYNGQDAMLLSIYKASTANASEVSGKCKDAMDTLEKKYPGLKIVSFSDQSEYISMFIDSVLSSILIGALLAIAVLALFLKSVKPTIVVAFSIPFSVLFAIVVMYFTGININVMSLAGLTLGIGMLVDNSIVVIENIFRLRARGISAPRAAVQGTKQVAAPIIASTLTTICVFLPMVFTTGMVRDLVIPFALTISYALTASLLVAVTVVPTMGSVLLKNTKQRKHPWFDKVLNVYGKMLAWCLRFKVVAILVAIGLLVFSVIEVFRMGIVMIPNMNGDTISVMAEVQEGTENEEAVKLADKVLDALLTVDGISDIGAMDSASTTNMLVGSAGPGGQSGNKFTGFVYYVLADADINTTGEIEDLVDNIKAATDNLGCDVTVGSEEASTQMIASGLSVNIYGADVDTLIKTSRDVVGIMEGVEGLKEVSNGLDDEDKAIHLTIDKDKAAKKGLTVAQIYSTISGKLTTQKDDAATIKIDKNEVGISIVDEREPLNLENLMDMELEVTKPDDQGNNKTKTYKLSDFAAQETIDSANVITRENQTYYMTVTSETEDGYNATLISRDLQPLLDKYEAPDGVEVKIAGESEEAMNMVTQMINALALGLLFIYLVMVAQFQSLLSPFIVLFTIPLAFTGGLVGLLIAGEEISAMSMMGFMVLMGTVVNNGIVFVDYVNQLRIQGLDKRNALIATGKTRMRPILMTAITTVLGMSNMVFTQEASASMSKGMAIVIAGGLLYSTLMTLFIIPIMYDILFRKTPKIIDVGDDLEEEANDAEEYMKSLALSKGSNGNE